MLNEPAFVKGGEVQAATTLGLDHIEVQAAISATNHVGVVGGLYRGISFEGDNPKGTTIYEGGLNFYTLLNRNTLSFTSGFSLGQKNTAQWVTFPLVQNKQIEVDYKYQGLFFQLAYTINKHRRANQNRTTFLVKSEVLNYLYYNSAITNYSGTGYYHYKVSFTTQNRETHQTRFAVIFHRQKKNSALYWQTQFGLNVTYGFKIDDMKTEFGNYKTDENQNYENMHHAGAFPLFLNILFGFKI